jgi:multimeric flavodoxin WrbA
MLLGSPRKRGNSAILAEEVIRGMEKGGAEVTTFFLQDMNIHPCNACMYCEEEHDRHCSIEDDMDLIYPKLLDADVIVFASPVYWFHLSAQTKLVIDRFYALGKDEKYLLQGKRFGLVLSYGDTDPFTSGAVNAIRSLQDALSYIDAHFVGCVYGSADKAGEIGENKSLLEEAYRLGEALVGN